MGNKLSSLEIPLLNISIKSEEDEYYTEQLLEEKQYAKEQLDIYDSFLEDEYLELCDEVHKYRFTHKTQIIRDRTLLFKLQDNAIRRNCYFLNKSLAINLNKKQKNN